MNEQEVVALMGSSKSAFERNSNADKVKAACNGYPDFWFKAVIMSGLCDRTLGAGSSEIKITSGPGN